MKISAVPAAGRSPSVLKRVSANAKIFWVPAPTPPKKRHGSVQTQLSLKMTLGALQFQILVIDLHGLYLPEKKKKV